jgi:hypothetical protein
MPVRLERWETKRLAHVREPRSARNVGCEILGGGGRPGGEKLGGCALEHDPAATAAGAGPRSTIYLVGVCHDRLMVLDDDDRLAAVDEPVEHAEGLLEVGEVEAVVGSSRT